MLADQRFEIPAPRHLGMVVFRLRGENHLTERLLKRLNARGNLHCVPAALKGRYVIRFTVTSQRTTGDDITRDWAEIRAVAAEVLGEEKQPITTARARVPLAGMRVAACCLRTQGERRLDCISQLELSCNSIVWV